MKKEQHSVTHFLKISRALWRQGDLLFCVAYNSETLENEEWVHDMRVLLRQLLSLLDFYKPVLKKRMYIEERKAIKKQLRALGAHRSEDVFVRDYKRYLESTEYTINQEEEALCRDFFRGHLGKKVSSAKDPYAQRKAFYGSAARYDHQRKRWERKKVQSQGASGVVFLHKRFHELEKNRRKAEQKAFSEKVQDIHALRIAGKVLYYNLLLHEELLAKEAEESLAYLKILHDVTGKIHDYDAHIKIFERYSPEEEDLLARGSAKEYFQREKRCWMDAFLAQLSAR